MRSRSSERFLRVVGLVLSVLAAGLVASCDDDAGDGGRCEPPSGMVPDFDSGLACSFPCPVAEVGDDAGGDTYTSFAAGFFETYCTRCHATTRASNCFTVGNPNCRYGAPSGANWDDVASIRRHLPHVREAVANFGDLTMPPDLPATPDPEKPEPSCEERYRLTRWIDSGAPGLP